MTRQRGVSSGRMSLTPLIPLIMDFSATGVRPQGQRLEEIQVFIFSLSPTRWEYSGGFRSKSTERTLHLADTGGIVRSSQLSASRRGSLSYEPGSIQPPCGCGGPHAAREIGLRPRALQPFARFHREQHPLGAWPFLGKILGAVLL